jgi:uncharacterized damage-inducible protein DinB
MTRKSIAVLAVASAAIVALYAQAPAPSTAASAKAAYARIKTNFVKAAEKMPEEKYNYKPVDALETFGQRVAHIADPQLMSCTAITGERKMGNAKSKTSKADLVAAIKESFDACDKAFDALTDANAMEPVTYGRGQQPRIAALYGLIVHANEVYGAMGVYMRLNGIVPPSSEGR